MEENETNKLKVYSYSPFGYEGTIVTLETDLRRGIPAVDIVGIADSTVNESRERILAAFRNSGIDFPAERVLMSASPADLRKDTPLDLAMALSIISEQNHLEGKPVLALGELELSGKIRPVRASHAAATTAASAGITDIICDKTTAENLKDIPGINVFACNNLNEAAETMKTRENAIQNEPKITSSKQVEFNEECWENPNTLKNNINLNGYFDAARAIEIAVAGKLNILQTGAPSCGKTLLMTNLIPALTPQLTEAESIPVKRIYSLAGIDSSKKNRQAPFRMPHQTATIEGICGGGTKCLPGEISLAHNGTLFLDEAAEFKSSVLQMLRVPIETKSITLSRAGRSTIYPANFQLAMAMNPCPCGNFHSPSRICLDSAKSIELYWKKVSDPLLDRIQIKNFVQQDENDNRKITPGEMREHVKNAYEIQRKRGIYNGNLNLNEINEYCKLSKESIDYFKRLEETKTPCEKKSLLQISLTIANMDGREEIRLNDLQEANELCSPLFKKPGRFKYYPVVSEEKEKPIQVSEPVLKAFSTQKETANPKEQKKEEKHQEEPLEKPVRKKKKSYEMER